MEVSLNYPEDQYYKESAMTAKDKAEWARFETGAKGRSTASLEVNHKEAIVICRALQIYSQIADREILQAKM